jgi:hypothetical protein
MTTLINHHRGEAAGTQAAHRLDREQHVIGGARDPCAARMTAPDESCNHLTWLYLRY